MRAMVIGEGGIQGLKIVDRDDSAPVAHEVLIEMHATSLNYRDLLTVKNGATQPGLVPNSCGAGTVIAVGEGVTRFETGDRVVPIFFQKWLNGPPTAPALSSALGGPIDGCLQEQMALHEDGLLHIPDYMSFDEAATLPCAALTAWRGLVEEGHLIAGRYMFENMLRAMTLHETRPVIDSRYEMSDTQTAFRQMKQGGHIGKIVINH